MLFIGIVLRKRFIMGSDVMGIDVVIGIDEVEEETMCVGC